MNFVVPAAAQASAHGVSDLELGGSRLTRVGTSLTNISLAVGEFSKPDGSLTATELAAFSRRRRVDYISGAANLGCRPTRTLMNRNKLRRDHPETRAPGMGYMRMPVSWLDFACREPPDCAAFPVLTDCDLGDLLLCSIVYSAFISSLIDRRARQRDRCTSICSGFGPPEGLYTGVCPSVRIFSEGCLDACSGKPLFGYRSMSPPRMSICVLSFIVWLHPLFFFNHGSRAMSRLLRGHDNDHRRAAGRQVFSTGYSRCTRSAIGSPCSDPWFDRLSW